jgi:hypothetical protein
MSVPPQAIAPSPSINLLNVYIQLVARVNIVLKTLGYKPEGRRFDARWGDILNLPNISGRSSLLNLLRL